MADSGYLPSSFHSRSSDSPLTNSEPILTGAEGIINVLNTAERIFAKYATLFHALFPTRCRTRDEHNFIRYIDDNTDFFIKMKLRAERLKEPLRELFKNTNILESSDKFVRAFDRAIDYFNSLVYGSLRILDICHGDDMRNNFLTWRKYNLQEVENHLTLADKWAHKVTSKANEIYYMISMDSLNHGNCNVTCQRTYRRQRPNARK
jgi:hypothetical protein